MKSIYTNAKQTKQKFNTIELDELDKKNLKTLALKSHRISKTFIRLDRRQYSFQFPILLSHTMRPDLVILIVYY